MFDNGTLLIESLLLPIEAKVTGRMDLSGVYTCVALNIAGITNVSSYVLPLGSKICSFNDSHNICIASDIYTLVIVYSVVF